MYKEPPFHPGLYYHIYNRGNNGETLFRQERNYRYFLELYIHYIFPIAETFAYCLLPNHFHFLIRIRDLETLLLLQGFKERQSSDERRSLNAKLGQQFATLFGTYTKTINNRFNRTGSLFEKPVHRKLVDSDAYFTALVAYIHRNPQNHGLIDDYKLWPHSSYQALLSEKPSRVERTAVLNWFDGTDSFHEIHQREMDEKVLTPFLFDE
ncbi:MAG: hypothetical protein H6636_03135 [Anaerolineales bacterium]|nr:hypothetical protein [Anaerolineales bacterium]